MLVGAAGAVTTTNTVCRIVLETTTEDTLISIPLVDCTNGEISGALATINPTNLVMTTGLPDGAALLYNDAGVWKSWVKSGTAWSAVNTVIGDTNAVAAVRDTFERGEAVRLYISGASTSNPYKVYLFGQYNKGDVTKLYGSGTAGAYTLVGNAQPKDITLGTLPISATAGDKIAVPASTGTKLKEYIYQSGWKSIEFAPDANDVLGYNLTDATSVTIPAGRAFWYVTKTAETKNVTWAAMP